MIFIDRKHQEYFDKRGYIILPYLDDIGLNKIKQKYTFSEYGIDKPFYISIEIPNTDLRKKIQKELQEDVLNYSTLSSLVPSNFKLFSTSYISQSNEIDSGFYMHTDWSFFDQTTNHPVFMWVPMQTVNKTTNGTMVVVPGSHKISIPYRGENIIEHYIQKIADNFSAYYEYLDIPAGHAVFFNPAIIHGLQPNTSSQNNISFLSLLCERAADIIYCYRPRYNIFNYAKVYKVIEMDDYWYVKNKIKDKSCLMFLKWEKIPNTKLNKEQIQTILDNAK